MRQDQEVNSGDLRGLLDTYMHTRNNDVNFENSHTTLTVYHTPFSSFNSCNHHSNTVGVGVIMILPFS